MPKPALFNLFTKVCSALFEHRWRFIRYAFLLAAMVNDAALAVAQTGGLYGRTTASGLWSTGSEWIDFSGSTGTVPTSVDDVVIGSTDVPTSAVSPATVTLEGLGSAKDLLIGDLSGGLGNGTLTLTTGGFLSAATVSLESSLGGTATLNLNDQTVTLSNSLSISGTGSSVTRGSGGITANGFFIQTNAVYASGGSDNFSGAGSVTDGGTFIANVAMPSLDALTVSGSGSNLTANATIAGATAPFAVSSGAAFTVNADVSAYSFTAGDTVLTLASGTLSAVDLVLGNAPSSPTVINRLGGSIIATTLTIENSTSLTTAAGDSISNTVLVASNATLSLGQNLALFGTLTINSGTLELNGNTAIAGGLELRNGASVTRSGGGGIQTASFTVSESTTFTAQTGDTLSGAGMVSDGASFITDVELSDISSLTVSGDGTSFTGNETITGAAASVNAFGGGAVTLNAGLSGAELRTGLGSLTIAGGTVSVSELDLGVFFAGTTTITRTGGTVLANNLLLGNGVAFTSLPGDQIGSMIASGSSSLTVSQSPGSMTGLWITLDSPTALQLNDVATMKLDFGGGYDPNHVNWALKWTGDHVSLLESLRSDGRLIINAPEDSQFAIAYSSVDNVTLVNVVPEPSAAALAAIGMFCGLCEVVRRLRRQ